MLSLCEIVRQTIAGKRSPVETADWFLSQIEAGESRLHAWVEVNASGVRQAALDLEKRLRNGAPGGPLCGAPLGVKDIIDVAGLPTRAGSPLRRNAIAEQDADVVAMLRRADALFLGKTVTTEFAGFAPAETRNPWNLARTPGGSSSGSAAAVAAGMCVAALGSQTGGSITRPATYCGVAGMKPTFGRVSCQRVAPVSIHLDHVGPLARSVHDLEIIWRVIRQPNWQSTDHGQATTSFARPPKLGVFSTYFHSECSGAVRAATERAISLLQAGGAVVETIALPESFQDLHRLHRCIMAVGAAETHKNDFTRHPDQFGVHLASLIEEGLHTSGADFSAAREHQHRFRQKMETRFGEVDAFITPAANTTAPSIETTGDPAFNSPWSYSGQPTVSLPAGLAADGLPVALQLIGSWGADDRLLQIAKWCEKQLPPMEQPISN